MEEFKVLGEDCQVVVRTASGGNYVKARVGGRHWKSIVPIEGRDDRSIPRNDSHDSCVVPFRSNRCHKCCETFFDRGFTIFLAREYIVN